MRMSTRHTKNQSDENLIQVKWKPMTHDILDIVHELKMIENVDGDRPKIWNKIYEKHLKILCFSQLQYGSMQYYLVRLNFSLKLGKLLSSRQ